MLTPTEVANLWISEVVQSQNQSALMNLCAPDFKDYYAGNQTGDAAGHAAAMAQAKSQFGQMSFQLTSMEPSGNDVIFRGVMTVPQRGGNLTRVRLNTKLVISGEQVAEHHLYWR
jgi:hypothetical protein